MSNSIPSDKHVLVCGGTGTGKSFLAEMYLRGYEYVVKLDTKQETDERYKDGKSPWNGLVENRDFTVARHYEELDDIETKKIIYCPDFEDMNEDTYNQFFKWIYLRGNTILWIDELMSIGSVQSYPIELKRLMTMGRSKGIGVWSCTQRPSGIPAIVPANCSYFFIFNLTLPVDRKKMVDITGQPVINKIPGGHNFYYYQMGDERPTKAILKV